jgi:hypothetical protein
MWRDADSGEAGRGRHHDAADDQSWDTDDGRTYWRRRFLILCGGVAALGVCAWLFPGASQPSAHEVAATRASMAALAKQQALPPAATGPAWPVPSPSPSPSPSPTLTPTPTASLANAANKKHAAAPVTHSSPGPTVTPGVPQCAPAHIVLSLFTGQPSYPKGAQPSFSVYAVSTASAACTLTYGAGSVQVVVTRHGQVVWDSSACKPPAAKAVRFTQGVPQVLTIAWDPAAKSPPGCAGSLPAGNSGTLDAVAMSHGQSSTVRSFQVSG